jgi:ribose transport system permease protein
MLVLVLLLLVAALSIASPYFFTPLNLKNILVSVSVTGILAVPMTLLLIAGHLDISSASVAAFCGMLMVLVSGNGDGSLVLGIVTALAVGAVAGSINGALVTMLGVHSIITTLGTLAIFRGATKLASNGQSELLRGFNWLGSGDILGVPVQIILVSLILLIVGAVLHYTVHGRRIYASGSNEEAARLAGIPVAKVAFLLFLFSGMMAGLAGLVVVSQLRVASPVMLEGLELTVITAVIVGGASLHGGKGTLIGTVLGVLILGVLNNGMTILSISAFWQEIMQGAVLIFAVSFDQIRELSRRRKLR